MSIEIKDVNKLFGDFVALQDVSLNIPTGQLTALLGSANLSSRRQVYEQYDSTVQANMPKWS